eukprot:COSAG02_NODE_9888_length_2082_cov_2.901160_1_plen_366_part_10
MDQMSLLLVWCLVAHAWGAGTKRSIPRKLQEQVPACQDALDEIECLDRGCAWNGSSCADSESFFDGASTCPFAYFHWTHCPPGSFFGENRCTRCQPGAYDHDWSYGTACVPCPDGKTSAVGATSCFPAPCTEGLSPAHALANPNGTAFACSGSTGDVCSFTCDPGYEAIGMHVCFPDGRFAGGSCVASACTSGLSIPNSGTVCRGATGDECAYSCDCGFEPMGRRTCTSSGAFVGGVCSPCPAGHAGIAGECTPCADGFEPSESGCDCVPCRLGTAGTAGRCAPCQAGRSPSTGRDNCEGCPLGTASSSGVSCLECGYGHYTDGIVCTRAHDGMAPTVDRTGQVPCRAGWAGVDGMCEPCAAGRVP